MATPGLRIGLVGAGGNMVARHLPGFRAVPGVELVAVANRTRASAERVAAAWGIPRVEADWRAVVDSPRVDAVCIGTWPDQHAELTAATLAVGKHVLCEARMAASLTEAEDMARAAARAPDRVAQLVPAPMTLAVDDAVLAWLARGELGELRAVEVVHRHGDYLDPQATISWRQRRRYSGVNMLSLGIFYEILLRWLGTEARVTAAEARIATPMRRDAQGRACAVDLPEEVLVHGVFPTPGGATLRMDHSGLHPGDARMEIRLSGSARELRWDGRRGRVDTRPTEGNEEDWHELIAPARDAWAVEAEFVASVREGAPVRRTDFATGVRYMRFTDAAWRALGWS